MNKTYKYTLTAHEKKEISFDTGVSRLAIANGDGVDGSTTVIMSEITKQHSGDIVSFLDGADAPFADFKVNIEAVQSGSGDPSPTNVRPISGIDSVKVAVCGKNLLTNGIDLANRIHNAFNSSSINTEDKTVTFTPVSSEGYPSILYRGARGTKEIPFEFEYPYKENTQYTFIIKATTTSTSLFDCGVSYTDGTNNGGMRPSMVQNGYIVFTSPADKTVESLYIGLYSGTTTFWYEEMGVFEGIVSLADVDFTPRKTYTVTMPAAAGTIYGGTLNVKTGVLTVTHANIASYDGETINEPWISSMDKYVAGTTPTTGAQVVYPLTTHITYQLTPTEIRSLLGQNNIYANCGPVNVRYFVQSTQPMIDYVDDKTPVFFDAVEDLSTYDVSLVGATSTDIKNYLLANKNANIVIRVKRYSTILLYYLREYSPNYFAEFATPANVFDAEGTKSMRIDYLRLDLTQETSDFTDDYIILPTT